LHSIITGIRSTGVPFLVAFTELKRDNMVTPVALIFSAAGHRVEDKGDENVDVGGLLTKRDAVKIVRGYQLATEGITHREQRTRHRERYTLKATRRGEKPNDI
jgi:hypothetical protein